MPLLQAPIHHLRARGRKPPDGRQERRAAGAVRSSENFIGHHQGLREAADQRVDDRSRHRSNRKAHSGDGRDRIVQQRGR